VVAKSAENQNGRPKVFQLGGKDNLMHKILQMGIIKVRSLRLSFLIFKPKDFLKEDDFKNGKMKCGGVYELGINRTVFISSPYYPTQYPTNIICNYFVKVS